MKLNDFNTNLYKFLYDFFVGCKFRFSDPLQSAPLPLDNDLLPILLKRFVYDFDPIMQRFVYVLFTRTSLIQIEKKNVFYYF